MAPRENVINLAEILRNSLEKESGKPPAGKASKTKTADGSRKRKSAA